MIMVEAVAEPCCADGLDVMGPYYQGRLDMMRSITDVLHRDPSVLSHDWIRECLVGAERQLAEHLAQIAPTAGTS